MNILNFTFNLASTSIIVYIIKIYSISMCTYYTFLKLINIKNLISLKTFIVFVFTIIITFICGIIKYTTDSFTSIACLILLLSSLYSNITKNKIGYTIILTITSLSINYTLFFLAILINFAFNLILAIQNDYLNIGIMIITHITILYLIFKIKRFKDGFSFLQINLKNEYFDILILNISVSILLSFIILNNFNLILTASLIFCFIIFMIIMFITIQKTLTMYYKHKLLVSELEETKTELENKNKEIEQLEAENLNFSKISHSIAHKQKSLEHKLNQLMLNNEIAPELDISNKVKELSNQCFSNITTTELPKTDIEQIDDMLSFMQDECTKNNIDFEIKLNGNIHHMINNFIDKNDLEILLADHIKNAIIAINHSDNINRSILVKLGMIDGYYGIYVYDSGIEFEIDTLINLGEKPSSTHLDDGGSGMGFLNTFDTLSKCQASIIINEINPPSKENYTKFIAIIFDNKNEYKISSYRSEKIKNVNKRKDLIIEN